MKDPTRLPMMHMAMLYGGPPSPSTKPWRHPDLGPEDPWQPEMFPVLPDPVPTTTGQKIVILPPGKVVDPQAVDWKAVEKALKENREAAEYERVKTNVRVVTRKEADGTIKLKVYVDGELKTEVESDGSTLSTEFDL